MKYKSIKAIKQAVMLIEGLAKGLMIQGNTQGAETAIGLSMDLQEVLADKSKEPAVEAAKKLLQNNLLHFDKELQTMSINPDITGCSKSVTINGIVVTISFEREEDEL